MHLVMSTPMLPAGFERGPALAQSQQGSPVPTLAAMPWKIVLMWGLWERSGSLAAKISMKYSRAAPTLSFLLSNWGAVERRGMCPRKSIEELET